MIDLLKALCPVSIAVIAAIALMPPVHAQTAEGAAAAGAYSKPTGNVARPAFERLLGDPGAIEMSRLVPALFYAISQLSKYPVPGELPVLHRVSRETLEEMSCIGKCAVLANYLPGEGIFLADELQPETDLFARSVLLHELVHYLQDVRNVRANEAECLRWYYREVEAYSIQRRFLLRIGSPIRVGYLPERPACVEELKSQPVTTLYDE
ncbi:MAG TPA: hypothetical protein VMP00_03460 [Burkholderiales bacterium]|nr:hypothetical protein [Burkholderiales bacterium]